MGPSDFGVKANCRRLLDGATAGSGEWICTVVWKGPHSRTLRDNYELWLTTDGCYVASIDGEALGGPTLKAEDGRVVRNLLHTFEGCFDTM
jgi:hypothetical protein